MFHFNVYDLGMFRHYFVQSQVTLVFLSYSVEVTLLQLHLFNSDGPDLVVVSHLLYVTLSNDIVKLHYKLTL